jgi:hypothetical protein
MIERLKKVNVNLSMTGHSKRSGGLGDYETGRTIDLVEWQRYFQTDAQQQAAADEREAARAVLAWLMRWSSELEEFSAAAARPFARFPLDYSKGVAIALPHLPFLTRFSIVYSLRANATLEVDDGDQAFRDLETLDRTQAAIGSEPLLVSHLARIVIIKSLMQPVWQGLVSHRGREDHLQEIEAMLARMDLITDYAHVVRGERVFANLTYEQFRAQRRRVDSITAEYFARLAVSRPPSWLLALSPADAVLRHNQLWNDRWVQDRVLPNVDPLGHRIYPAKEKEAEKISNDSKATPYNFIARIATEIYPGVTKRTATIQAAIDQARLGCALERFRLKSGHFPDTLDALTPDYFPVVPFDVIDGKPLRYRLESDGNYLLYSVGWNEVDNGGVISKKSTDSSRRNDELGDWVWPSSARK